jgi:hypothetical protein
MTASHLERYRAWASQHTVFDMRTGKNVTGCAAIPLLYSNRSSELSMNRSHVGRLLVKDKVADLPASWQSDLQCLPGYVGPLCMNCDAERGYLKRGNACEFCNDGPANPTGAVVFLIVSAFLLSCVVFVVVARTQSQRELHDSDSAEADHLSDVIRILITYIQILSVMGSAYGSVEWPKSFEAYSEAMGFINFDVGFVMPVASCSLSISYSDQFFLHLASPLVFGVFVQIAKSLAMAFGKCGKKCKDPVKKSDLESRKKTQKNMSAFININIMMLMYPGLSTKIFSVFKCMEVPGKGQYMVMDFSVKCYDSLTHQTLVIVAGIGLFFYTLGFPVYLFLDLYRNRKFLHNEEKQKKEQYASTTPPGEI